jgi:acetyl esterase/lipase
MLTYTYKTVDGLPIHADVYRAPGDGPRPVLVWIHGGALMAGHRRSINGNLLEACREAGYTVVSIDYRLAPETKLPGIIKDIRDAFRWVREEGPKLFNIVPDRLGVFGGSAGGYLTLMTGFAVEPRPKALVALYGYGDIIGDWYSKPDPFYLKQDRVPEEEALAVPQDGPLAEAEYGERGRFYLYCRQNGLWPEKVLGVDPHENPDAFTPYCPVKNVTADYPPTLLLHGTADTDVPYQQSVDMAAALKAAGVDHGLITIEDGPHGFDGAARREHMNAAHRPPEAQALVDAVAFMAKYV